MTGRKGENEKSVASLCDLVLFLFLSIQFVLGTHTEMCECDNSIPPEFPQPSEDPLLGFGCLLPSPFRNLILFVTVLRG